MHQVFASIYIHCYVVHHHILWEYQMPKLVLFAALMMHVSRKFCGSLTTFVWSVQVCFPTCSLYDHILKEHLVYWPSLACWWCYICVCMKCLSVCMSLCMSTQWSDYCQLYASVLMYLHVVSLCVFNYNFLYVYVNLYSDTVSLFILLRLI